MEIREGHNKSYINDEQGKQTAEIVSVPAGENLVIIEHTDVDESLKGQGIGKQLVAEAVEKMRWEKRKVIPLCPSAKRELDKTREYDDVRSRWESIEPRYFPRFPRSDTGEHLKGRGMHKEWAESAFLCPESSPSLSKKRDISYMRIINRG